MIIIDQKVLNILHRLMNCKIDVTYEYNGQNKTEFLLTKIYDLETIKLAMNMYVLYLKSMNLKILVYRCDTKRS